MAITSLLIILIVLAALLVLGVPITYAIGISALAAIVQLIPLDISVFTGAQRTFVGVSILSLTAIPFFVMAGNLMNTGGIAKRLVNFVLAILGKVPGSLMVTNVGASALFGAISGSGSAAAAAVGSMIKEGEDDLDYDPAMCAATNVGAAPCGLIIPPSNTIITYSLVSGGTSVAALFLAGYLPGLLWALGCMVVAVFMARRRGYTGLPGVFSWKYLMEATLEALPSLSLIVVVIGGIIGGIFTATEGAAVSVVYALVLSICYKSITLESFWKVTIESAKMSAMVIFLVGVSNILGWVMAFTMIPQAIGQLVLGLTQSPVMIFLLMNVVLLVAGTFIDVTPAILIFTPLFLPIAQQLGMSPVQFGLMLVYNLSIGSITPPVGNTLFVGIKVGRTSLAKIMPHLMPYYAAILIGLLLTTYVPFLTMALPQAAGLVK